MFNKKCVRISTTLHHPHLFVRSESTPL